MGDMNYRLAMPSSGTSTSVDSSVHSAKRTKPSSSATVAIAPQGMKDDEEEEEEPVGKGITIVWATPHSHLTHSLPTPYSLLIHSSPNHYPPPNEFANLSYHPPSPLFSHHLFSHDIDQERTQFEEQIYRALSERRWNDIVQYDELCREINEGRVLPGFTCALPRFPPTFKRIRQKCLPADMSKLSMSELKGYYDAKRLPAYTDRILYRSLPGFTGNEWC